MAVTLTRPQYVDNAYTTQPWRVKFPYFIPCWHIYTQIQVLPLSYHGFKDNHNPWWFHYNDVILGEMESQIVSLTIVYPTVYLDADQRKHQSSASLAFVWGNLPGTGEFPAQMASNGENVSIWLRHHAFSLTGGADDCYSAISCGSRHTALLTTKGKVSFWRKLW